MDDINFPWSFPLSVEDSGMSPVFDPSSSTASSLDGGSIGPTISTGTPPGLETAICKDMAMLNQAQATTMLMGSTPYERSELSISSLMQADLDQLYFDRIHIFIPILHRKRCLSWRQEPSRTASQTALQYALRTLAAAGSANYLDLRDSLYQQARKALEALDLHSATSTASSSADVEQVQAWLLLTIYELRCVGFRRGWITAGRAFRLIQLDKLWLRDLDTSDMALPQTDCIETETKRRTFWVAYCLDRFISLRNGSAPTFNEQVTTQVRLPASETDFQNSQLGALRGFLSDDADDGTGQLVNSEFMECILVAEMAGCALSHRNQQSSVHSSMYPLSGGPPPNFWDQHVRLDALVRTRMDAFTRSCPVGDHESCPMRLFTAMMWRAVVLCLQQTMDSVSAPSDETRAIALDYAKRSAAAAQDMVGFASKVAELNCWKLHPLMPIPLSLCGEMFGPNGKLGETLSQHLNGIADVMPGLRSFENIV